VVFRDRKMRLKPSEGAEVLKYWDGWCFGKEAQAKRES
jgi:hypothetical protein